MNTPPNSVPAMPRKGQGVFVTTQHSAAMIALAKKELVKLFSTGKVFRPGNLEDLFAGRWSLDLGYWRATPHFPALAQLVNEGIVDFGIMPDGDVVYAKTGKLPKKAKK